MPSTCNQRGRGAEKDRATWVSEHVSKRDEALIGDFIAGQIEFLQPHRCLPRGRE